MNINWKDSTLRFDPNSPDPFATHGIPLPVYGNYGGPNWSAGQVGGIATNPPNPPPVDQLDTLFWAHDLAYQSSTDPLVRAAADILLVQQMHNLTYTDPGQPNYDPEAGLYEGFSTLAILLQLAAGGVPPLPNQTLLVQDAITNIEAGLAEVPGEAKSLHGAFHVFEHQYLDFLL